MKIFIENRKKLKDFSVNILEFSRKEARTQFNGLSISSFNSGVLNLKFICQTNILVGSVTNDEIRSYNTQEVLNLWHARSFKVVRQKKGMLVNLKVFYGLQCAR